MVYKKVSSRSSNAVSFLFALGLLGSSFVTPSWAMDEVPPQVFLPHKKHFSLFDCNFECLEKAEQAVKQASSLPENIRSWFAASVRTYKREQFLDSQKQEEIFEKQAQIDRGSELSKELLKQFVGPYKILYEPYLENIKNNINEKGSLNYALFDTFFYMLLEVKEKEVVQNVLQNLENVGFLKNFNWESLNNIEESYGPSAQLKVFYQNNKAEDITTLIIAGGHIGPEGMESISRYNKAITIDLRAIQCPDIISDINNPILLQTLLTNHAGRLEAIYDTSNMKGFADNGIMTRQTHEKLVRLLKPGGQLRIQTSINVVFAPFFKEIVDYWTTTYGLVPIHDVDGNVIGLKRE